MKSPLLALASATALACAALAVPASAADGGRPLEVMMTGAAERPDPGDPDGSGTATFRINPGQMQVCYTLTVENIEPATAAHIHVAGPDDPGPVVIPLEAPTDGTSSGCADADRALAKDLLQNPQNYYVNVHNADYPAGAVRGQLG
jgi:hypothetical protein